MIPYPCRAPSASAVRIRNVGSCMTCLVIPVLYTDDRWLSKRRGGAGRQNRSPGRENPGLQKRKRRTTPHQAVSRRCSDRHSREPHASDRNPHRQAPRRQTHPRGARTSGRPQRMTASMQGRPHDQEPRPMPGPGAPYRRLGAAFGLEASLAQATHTCRLCAVRADSRSCRAELAPRRQRPARFAAPCVRWPATQ